MAARKEKRDGIELYERRTVDKKEHCRGGGRSAGGKGERGSTINCLSQDVPNWS